MELGGAPNRPSPPPPEETADDHLLPTTYWRSAYSVLFEPSTINSESENVGTHPFEVWATKAEIIYAAAVREMEVLVLQETAMMEGQAGRAAWYRVNGDLASRKQPPASPSKPLLTAGGGTTMLIEGGPDDKVADEIIEHECQLFRRGGPCDVTHTKQEQDDAWNREHGRVALLEAELGWKETIEDHDTIWERQLQERLALADKWWDETQNSPQ